MQCLIKNMRTVNPEILGSIDCNDPKVVRSRREFRAINRFLRGESWIRNNLKGMSPQKIIELGAGDGWLAERLKRDHPNSEVIAVDVLDRPERLPEDIKWVRRNALDLDIYDGAVVVANLFLHQLEPDLIDLLNEKVERADLLLFAEPYRDELTRLTAQMVKPFMNEVTRKGMDAGVNGGFRIGELSSSFRHNFRVSEDLGLFGGIRFMGVQAEAVARG